MGDGQPNEDPSEGSEKGDGKARQARSHRWDGLTSLVLTIPTLLATFSPNPTHRCSDEQ